MNSPLKREPLLSFLAVTAGVMVIYGWTLGFGFVWDDFIEVAGNDVFHQWQNFGKFFSVPYWTLLNGGFAPYHRPMIPVMVLLVSTFFGKNPFGYHLLNLILFTLTAWTFYLFLLRWPVKRWIAAAAAAIFIAHPIHAEAVSWGSARPVLLSGLCFIACLYFSHRAQDFKNSARVLCLTVLFSFFTLGLLTYHSILTLAPLVFLSDFFHPRGEKKSWGLRITEYLGYAILGIGFISLCLFLFHQMGEKDLRPFYSPAAANLIYTGAPFENPLAFLNTLTRYTELLLFPMNLVPDAYFKASELSLSAIGCFVTMALITLKLAMDSRWQKPALFSALWMFCGILTAANFVPQGGLFADRYVYISSMGFALWTALVLEALREYAPAAAFKNGRVFSAIFLSLLLLWSLKTVSYSRTWKNDFTYWLEASILSPEKARTHNRLGMLLEQNGYLAEAAESYQKTLNLDAENFVMTYQQLAGVLTKLGRSEEAGLFQKRFEKAMSER